MSKERKPRQGYMIGGGIKAFPHNLMVDMKRNKFLYLILAIVLTYFLIFHYAPMAGLLMAFEKYSPTKGLLRSKWIGLANFKKFFNGPYFFRLMKNTVIIGVLDMVVNFPAPIIFALLLNEIRQRHFKKIVQTVSYAPYFISSVVAAGLIISFMKSGGIISDVFAALKGIPSLNMLDGTKYFRAIYILSGTWQTIGYGSIIYLSALSSVDQELYDAAKVDGAGYWKQCIHVTLPGITPMIVIMFIMRMGTVFSVPADKILLLYNPSNYEVSDVINTYVYRLGLEDMNFGMSTAVGFFNSVIGTTLLLISNTILKKNTDSSLF